MKRIFLICLILVIISISAVSATENITDNLHTGDLNETIQVTNAKSFTDLDTDINSNTNSQITLKSDYIYNSTTDSKFKNGVVIKKDVTINGNGHTLDGNYLARIFTTESKNIILKNINFVNGNANKEGGAIKGDATVINCNFTNNVASYYGGAIYGNCSIKSSNFIKNNATRFYGGAVYGKSTIEDSNFEGNFARLYGGAIYGATATGSTFKENRVNQQGGAIYKGTAINCDFIKNTANTGGAVHTSNIQNSNFEANTAGDGGAAYNSSITNSIFKSNTARQRGGAVAASNVKGSQFIKNVAEDNGGAGFNGNYESCIFKDNTVIKHKGNLGQYGGGALYNATSVIKSSFENNTAQWGGAILKSQKVEYCNFTNNRVTGWAENHCGYGGAVYEASVKGCNFIKNTADGNGGAIYGCGDAVDCTFEENIGALGGAIYNCRKAENCNFTKNTATGYDVLTSGNGGAIFNGSAENCNFIENTATGNGAGIWNGSAENCNFIKNDAELLGGGVFMGNAVNCEFIQNHADRGGAIYEGIATKSKFTNNNASSIGGAIAGVFNSYAVDCTFIGNHVLLYYGGAIDGNATNCLFKDNYAKEIGGALFGDRNNFAENCEFINNSAKNGGAIGYASADNCSFTKNVADENGGAIFGGSALESKFSDNSAQKGGAIYKTTASKCEFGKNTANEGSSAYEGKVSSDCTFSSPKDTYNTTFYENSISFSDLNSEINSNNLKEITLNENYLYNEATDYLFEKGIVLNRDITINGKGHILNGNDAARIFDVQKGNVILKNIIFTNASILGNGAAIYGNATVINCTFKNNRAIYYLIDKNTYGGAMYGGKAIDSTFINNYAKHGGAITNAEAVNCRFIENNADEDGGAAYMSKISDSTFTSNEAKRGGAIAESTAAASKFISNTAHDGGAAYGTDTIISKCEFSKNTAVYGGAVNYVSSKITDSVFSENIAKYSGGALYKADAQNCNFTKNQAVKGGAASCSNAYGCIFTQNTATEQAGAIYGEANTAENCQFVKNAAQYDNPTFNVETKDCTFKDNPTGKIAEITVNVNATTYSEQTVADITSSVDGTIKADIDNGNIKNINVAADKLYKISFDGISAGKHTLTVTVTPTDTKINAVTVKKDFYVAKKLTSIILDVKDTTNIEDVIVYLTASENGKATVKLAGILKAVDVNANVKVEVNLGKINSGSYAVSASLNAGANYLESTASKTIKISEKITQDKINIEQPEGNSENIVVSLPQDAKGKVTLKIDGKSYDFNVQNGAANVKLPSLSNGDHPYTITYSGDEKYDGFTTSRSLKTNSENKNSTVKQKIDTPKIDLQTGKINLPQDATGTVTLTINNQKYEFKVMNGIADIKMPELKNGNYAYTIKYSGDSKYDSFSQNANLIVDNPVKITVNVNATTYSEQTVADITSSVDGTIKADIDNGNIKNINVAADKLYKISFDGISAGKHTLTVTVTPTDTKINAVTVKKDFYVAKKLTSIILDVKDTTNIEDVIVYLTASENGKATVKLAGILKAVDVNANVKVEVNLGKINSGSYAVSASLNAGANYLESTASKTIKISEKITQDKINIEQPEGNSENIVVSLPQDAKGKVTLKIDGKSYDFNVQNGAANVKLPSLSNGDHPYTITYSGDEKYDGFTTSRSLKTNSENKNSTVKQKIDTPKIDLQTGKINLPQDATGTVTLTINNQKYEFKVMNGIADIKMPELKNGNYAYTIKYSGDSKYDSFSQNANLIVDNPVNYAITASNVKVLYQSGKYYTIKVNASNVNVIIISNGKVFKTIPVDANGVAKFKITQKPGTYKLTLKVANNTLNKTLTVKHLVTLKKVTVKKSAKKLVLTATLAKLNKKYLKNKKITFKFNGKKYTAKTNKKGVAKVTIKSNVLKKLKVGKKVTYQATYLKDTVKKTVKIKK